MDDINRDSSSQSARAGGGSETIVAVLVCIAVMFLPVILIERAYEDFVSQHGSVREGAAGTTLALAVVVRTILRNFIRTSTRAGLRMGLRSSIGGVLRMSTRNLFAAVTRSAMRRTPAATAKASTSTSTSTTTTTDRSGPAVTRRHSNLRSLLLASLLLYASWVVVIGFGQPFADLMTAEQTATAEARENAALVQARSSSRQPGIVAWELDQHRNTLRNAVVVKRSELKAARTLNDQTRLADELSALNADLTIAQTQLSDALIRSGGRLTPPDDRLDDGTRKQAAELQDWLFTHSPYVGPVSWSSALIWGAAALFVLPLWLIYAVQSTAARRLGVPLRHETGFDGGMIQLYFAGAFSFMPLSSDVVIEGTRAERGRVSLVGILVPTAISILLWLCWKLGGESTQFVLLASDAFLIYPMVQCFPLDPLDGIRLFRWHRGLWAAVFVLVMSTFVFMGSEGLKHVI